MPHLHLIFGHRSLSAFTENVHGAFFKHAILVNRALFVTEMLSLFSKANSAYIHISLKEILSTLQFLKKFKISKEN